VGNFAVFREQIGTYIIGFSSHDRHGHPHIHRASVFYPICLSKHIAHIRAQRVELESQLQMGEVVLAKDDPILMDS